MLLYTFLVVVHNCNSRSGCGGISVLRPAWTIQWNPYLKNNEQKTWDVSIRMYFWSVPEEVSCESAKHGKGVQKFASLLSWILDILGVESTSFPISL